MDRATPIDPNSKLVTNSAVALGLFVILLGLAHAIIPQASEAQDWLFFFFLTGSLPLMALVTKAPTKIQELFLVAAVISLVFATIGGIIPTATDLSMKIPKSVSWFLGAGAAGLNLWLTCKWTVHLERRALPVTSEIGGPRWLLFSGALALIGAALTLSPQDRPFFWLQQQNIGAYAVLGFFAYFGERMLLDDRPNRTPGFQFCWSDAIWFVCCGLYSLVPFFGATQNMFHHWSYYLGPIEAVKHGGLLLYDAPSQYGLLSIALPAVLPFSSSTSFAIVFIMILFLQAALLYGVFRTTSFLGGMPVFAGVLAFATSYLLCGFRNELFGAFECPSTTGYRFLWAFALCTALSSRHLERKPLARSVTVASLFTIGALWSAESLCYCLCVLGAAWTAHLLLWIAGRSRESGPLISLALFPMVFVVAAACGITFAYRHFYQVAPDWYAFVEYALVYKGGFGALPINPIGGLHAWLAVFAVTSALLVCNVSSASMRPGLFGGWGFLIGTFTYFVSRSHPSNLVCLMCYAFAVLCLVVTRTDLDASHEKALRPIFLALSLALLVPAFPKPLGLARRFAGLAFGFPRAGSVESALSQGQVVSATAEKILAPSDAGAVLLDFTGEIPELALGDAYRPLLPIYPVSHFAILPDNRQRIYLERYFKRNPPPARLRILRRSKERWSALDRTVSSILDSRYQCIPKSTVDGLTIDLCIIR